MEDFLNNGLREFLNTPLKIGNKEIKNRLVLSPMAGLTTVSLREVISYFCVPGLLYTEMCLASMVPTENRNKSNMFRWNNSEKDVLVCQLVGNDEKFMSLAAKRIEREGLFGVDINMGCSISRICKKGYGAELLKEPDRAIEVVKIVRQSVNIPLIVKFRTGWEDDINFAVDFAKRLEDAGVDALIFHPRVAPDTRNREPKWEYIKYVKQGVSIPVFGNGNVFRVQDIEKMIEICECDGVALGRISAARPWIFAEALEGFRPTEDHFFLVATKMLETLFKYFEENRAIKLYKKWAAYFFANFFYAHSLLKQILKKNSYHEILCTLKKILIPLPRLLDMPNLNFLK